MRVRTLTLSSLLLIGWTSAAAFLPCVHNDVFHEVELVQKAMIFGKEDSRRELSAVMKDTKYFTAAEAKQLKKMVGTIYCPAGNGFESSVGTAFVMGKSDEIFTSGHLVANDDGGRRDVSTCRFTNFADPRESIMIDGKAKRTRLPDWGPGVGNGRYDRARLVLETPIKGAQPLQPDADGKRLVGGEQVFIASAHNRGFKSTYKDPIISVCSARDIEDQGDGISRIKTDCDLSQGGSGAPLLYRRDGKLVVKGLSITLMNMEQPDGTEYGKDTNFQNNLAFEDEFLTWVNREGMKK